MKILNILALAALSAFTACSSNEEVKEVVKEKIVLPSPVKKFEAIEVKPGLSFNVLNWGKSADSVSAITILRSDSVKQDYTSYNIGIKGKYIETINTDMDTDDNPELVFVTIANKKGVSSAEIYCLEYGGREPQRIKFPDLTVNTLKQYKGGDKFYAIEGKLIREIDLFDDLKNEKAKPVGKKKIQYSLKNNSFTIEELKD